MKIKNVIFDFGNVLFDLELSNIERNFRKAFGDQYDTALAKLRQNRIFELYETGGISSEEFVHSISNASHPPIPEETVVAAWNSIFLEMPAHRFEMLLELRKKYSVFLLSNINDIHERWIANYLEEKHGITDFSTRYFDAIYYSHLLRLRKPDKEIYEYVLADAELVPEETVFFDDLEVNVEAANRLGIRGILHPVGMEIAEAVRKQGLLF